MKIKFKNGITIEDLETKGTVRGNRCNLVTTPCCDMETGETVLMCLDIREPFDRYVPLWVIDNFLEERENSNKWYRKIYLKLSKILKKK